MKTLLTTIAVLFASCLAQAQNPLSVADITIPQNGQSELTIRYEFPTEGLYTGYSLSITLPEGISLVQNDKGKYVYTLGECHEDTHQMTANYDESDGKYKFGCLSLESDPLTGMSGVLLTLPVTTDGSNAVGEVLQATLQDANFGKLDGQTDFFTDVVAFTITIGEPDDGRLKFDENATKLPSYTAGEKADVTMKRTIKGGEWSTLVLPFNLTKANAEAAFGYDVQFAKFAGFKVDYGEDEENVTPLGIIINLTSYTIPARGNMAGGTPVLIKTSKDIEEIKLDGVTLTDGVKDVEVSDEYETPGMLTGTLVKSTIPADGLFISGNQFWYSTGNTAVKAFRCWFELDAVLGKDTDFGARVVLNFVGSDTEGISETVSGGAVSSEYYDLQGRRVEKPGKGLFVKGGKKIIIK